MSKIRLAGRKADYIDLERQKLHDSIKDSQDEDIRDIDESTNKYLEQVRAKYG